MKGIREIVDKKYPHKVKEELMELIKVIVNLSNKANVYGLLSLEEDYPLLHPFLLKKGIELIVKGFSPEDVESILNHYINSREQSEARLLKKLMIKESVLLLQSGERGEALFEKILSMFGEEFFEGFDYSSCEEVISFYNSSKDSPSISIESKNFDNRMMSIVNAEEMEKLVGRAGYLYMALALKISSSKINNYVRKQLRQNSMVKGIDDEVERIGPIRLKDGLDAQQFILRLLN